MQQYAVSARRQRARWPPKAKPRESGRTTCSRRATAPVRCSGSCSCEDSITRSGMHARGASAGTQIPATASLMRRARSSQSGVLCLCRVGLPWNEAWPPPLLAWILLLFVHAWEVFSQASLVHSLLKRARVLLHRAFVRSGLIPHRRRFKNGAGREGVVQDCTCGTKSDHDGA